MCVFCMLGRELLVLPVPLPPTRCPYCTEQPSRSMQVADEWYMIPLSKKVGFYTDLQAFFAGPMHECTMCTVVVCAAHKVVCRQQESRLTLANLVRQRSVAAEQGGGVRPGTRQRWSSSIWCRTTMHRPRTSSRLDSSW